MVKSEHKGNGHGHATETPDVSHIKNVDVTHELSDVNVPALLKFVLALTVMTIAVYVLMWGLFRLFNSQVNKKDPEPGPMAMSDRERLPPEPRLQGAPGFAEDLAKSEVEVPKDPLWEIRVIQEQWKRELKEGPKDSSGNSIGLPIEEAMKKLVQQGLPTQASESKSQDVRDRAIGMPTAASSGRVSMRARQ